ncbi:circumsporozoite protein- membrane associated protein [Rubripirellula reticaptiva]|nr:circumsporozoite protein- membrane associated protein [Rubripirellula reticaptiva]
MSIVSPSSSSRSPGSAGSAVTADSVKQPTGSTAAELLIQARIIETASALWWAELIRRSLGLVIAAIVGVLIWVIVDQWIYSAGALVRWIALVGFLVGSGWYVYKRVLPLIGNEVSAEYAARSLERDMPELRQALTSYITLRSTADISGLSGRVVRSIGASAAGRLKKHNALPVEATGTLAWWIATAIAMSILVGYAVVSPKNSLQSVIRLAAPMATIDSPRRVSIADVLPGDAEAIAGRAVDVSAMIGGMRADEQPIVQWDLPAGSSQAVLEPDAEGGPRRFVGSFTLPYSASGVVPYRIIAGDAVAGPFNLNVRDIPVVALDSVLYQPPGYTRQSEYTRSTGAIEAIEGTKITVRATVNRSVARAAIEFNPRPLGDTVRATAGVAGMKLENEGTRLSASFVLKGTRGRSSAVELDSYRIRVWDPSDQTNPDPIIYPIRVIADLAPEVAIVMPVNSPKNVPINAQQIIEVHAADPDFGLKEIRLEIRSGIDMIAQPVIWSPSADNRNRAAGNQVAEYRFRPGDQLRGGLGMRIGDTVEVIAVATDNRFVEGDQTIEPNVTRTDPITLRIVAADALPPAGDPESEGMSAPDDQPASNAKKKDDGAGGNSSGEGQPQSGGGSGGPDAKQQQPGKGESGGDSGESSGQNDSENEPSDAGSSGDGQSGESKSNDSQSGDQSSDPQGNEPGEKSTGSQDSGASGGDSSREPGQESDAEPGAESGGTEGQSSDSGSTPSGKQSDRNSSPAQSGERSDGENQGGESSSSGSKGEGKSDRQPGQPGSADGQGEPASPQHDAEAFERIKEYLDQKSKEGGQAEGQPSQGGESSSETGAGERDAGDKGSDQTNANQNGAESAGSKQGDAPESGESAAGDPSKGESSGDQSASDDPTGSPTDPQSASGEAGKADPGTGEPSGDQGQSGESASSAESRQSGQSGEPGQSDGNSAASDSSKSGSAKSDDSAKGEPSASDSGESASSGSNAASAKARRENQDDANSEMSPGMGDGNDGLGRGGDVELPPDAVNTDYAKEATDLVLDYLEQTRDQPDSELLRKLNWTPADLQKFRDRWKGVRDLGSPAGEAKSNQQIEDALRSLGLREPGTATTGNARDAADAMQGIRDSGNRKPPPAAYRDAFDAFRRSMGK